MHHDCCYRTALDATRSFCGECGGPLLRCAAFDECSGLVDTDGLCGVCIAPVLTLDAGALASARVGGALALPLVLTNAARVGRPLFLKGVWVREGSGDWRALDTPWDRLDAGASAPIPMRTGALEHAGNHRLDVAVALGSRWRWREEVVAFTAGLDVTVDTDDSLSIQQTIHYGGEGAAQGGTVYAPMRVEAERRSAVVRTGSARPLELVRAGRLEQQLGLRGGPDGVAVPRGARIAFVGFDSPDVPAEGPITTPDGVLSIGRSRSKQRGGPNEVRVLALDGSGGLDEQESLGVSRQHAQLYVENDRLMVRALSTRGLYLGVDRIDRGEARALSNGATFSLTRGPATALRVRIEAHHGVAHAVQISRA